MGHFSKVSGVQRIFLAHVCKEPCIQACTIRLQAGLEGPSTDATGNREAFEAFFYCSILWMYQTTSCGRYRAALVQD